MLKKAILSILGVLLCAGLAFGQVPYFSDFETDGGGWAPTGDWERGVGTGFAGGFSSTEPVGGFSGDFIWGTVIGGDHSPGLVSDLSQNFDFSASTSTVLSFYEWSDSGSNAFDMASVLVNGNQEYLSDGNSNDAWRQVVLDLGAYDGMASVDISFNFATTTVVERTGWYIDDVSITAIPEPASASLMGLCLLGVMGLCRRS